MEDKELNKKLVESINRWQSSDEFHPLTCGNDSRHQILEPFEENGVIKLRCPDCDYIQNWIPTLP